MRKNLSNLRTGFIGLLSAAVLVGCSDYPSSGYLDTSKQKQKVEIVDISGDVYGVQKGTSELVQKFASDLENLKGNGFFSEARKAVINNEETMPTLELTYPAPSDAPNMAGVDEAIIAFFNTKVEEVKAQVQEEIDEAQAQVDEAQAEYDSAVKAKEDFQNSVKDEEMALTEARDTLNAKIKEFESLKESSLAAVNAVLKKGGYSEYSERSTPFSDYRYIDYAQKGNVPSSCQADRYRVTIDMLAEEKMCLYLTDNSRGEKYAKVADEFKSTFKTNFLKNLEKLNVIGQKGSWNSEATGLWAKLDQAEDALENAQETAQEEFGNPYRIDSNIRNKNNALSRQKNNLERVSSEDYLNSQMTLGGMYFSNMDEKTTKLIEDYSEAVKQDLKTRITVVSKLTFNPQEENATFDNVKGDLEGYIVAGTIIGERDGRRQPVGVISLNDLSDPSLKDASELVDELGEKDGLRASKVEDEEEIFEEILERINDSPFKNVSA